MHRQPNVNCMPNIVVLADRKFVSASTLLEGMHAISQHSLQKHDPVV
jgi:hypothetical protein